MTATRKRTLLAAAPTCVCYTYAVTDDIEPMFNIVSLYHSTISVAIVDGITVMKSRKLCFAIFVALSLQSTHGYVQGIPCLACPKATNTINTTNINITNTVANISYFFGGDTLLRRLGPQQITAGSLDPLHESKADLPEGTQSLFSDSIEFLSGICILFHFKGGERRRKKSKTVRWT